MAKIYSAALVAALMATMAPSVASAQDYPHNYGENDKNTCQTGKWKESRYTNTLKMKSSVNGKTADKLADNTLSVMQETDLKMYYSFPDFAFHMQRGSTVEFQADPVTLWMAAYLYVDWGRDGQFDINNDAVSTFLEDAAAINVHDKDAVQPELALDKQWSARSNDFKKDIVAFSYYSGYNSRGKYIRAAENYDSPESVVPAFDVPTDVEPGYYYCRYKVDWDWIDPAGNTNAGNTMPEDGGVFVDTRVCIHDANVALSQVGDGGQLTLDDGTPVNGAEAAFCKTLKIKAPANFESAVVRHGYNLDGPQTLRGCKQWDEYTLTAADFTDGAYTINKTLVDGNIRFTAKFTGGTNGVNNVEEGKTLGVEVAEGQLTLTAAAATKVVVSDVQGHVTFNGTVEGTRTLNLAKGLYIVNGEKYLVK